MTQATASHGTQQQPFIKSMHGIRYQVTDVARSVKFYTEQLGFKLEHQHLPAFASVSLGDVPVLLSGPRRVRIAPVAEWATSGTRRLEPGRSQGRQFPRLHRDTQAGGASLSE